MALIDRRRLASDSYLFFAALWAPTATVAGGTAGAGCPKPLYRHAYTLHILRPSESRTEGAFDEVKDIDACMIDVSCEAGNHALNYNFQPVSVSSFIPDPRRHQLIDQKNHDGICLALIPSTCTLELVR